MRPTHSVRFPHDYPFEARFEIRVMHLDGNPWSVAKDFRKVLDHSNPTVALRILGDAENAKSDLGCRVMNIISKSDLYKLIMRSDKPYVFALHPDG